MSQSQKPGAKGQSRVQKLNAKSRERARVKTQESKVGAEVSTRAGAGTGARNGNWEQESGTRSSLEKGLGARGSREQDQNYSCNHGMLWSSWVSRPVAEFVCACWSLQAIKRPCSSAESAEGHEQGLGGSLAGGNITQALLFPF